MIITCDKCSTNFNLDNSIVKEEGSKCRCSVCKHIFTVYPLQSEPESDSDNLSDLDFESESSDMEMEENEFSLDDDTEFEIDDTSFEDDDSDSEEVEDSDSEEDEDSDFEIDDDLFMEETEESDIENKDDLSIEEIEDEADEDAADEDSINLELEYEEKEIEDSEKEDIDRIELDVKKDEPASLDEEDSKSELTMQDETDLTAQDSESSDENLDEDSSDDEEEFEFKLDGDDETEDETETFDISQEATEEISLEDEEVKTEEILETEVELPAEETQETEEKLSTDDMSEVEDFLTKDTQEKEKFLTEEIEPVMDETSGSRRRKKKKSIAGAPVIILLLIFLLAIGAYVASIMTGYKIPYLPDIKIPFIEQYLSKPVPQTVQIKPVPSKKSVNGRFVTNATAGTLFVITGKVKNPSDSPVSHIKIQGTLITKDKKKAKIKNAFCGNIVTEKRLQTDAMSEINQFISIKSGVNNSNVNIEPNATIPFMVVFSDLPEKLENFTVQVISFEKAKTDQ